ncbi:24223_t:CDS:2 [Dentiscutata erythropus]|uniref:24223_t:CDS:1 n=1 Tax=Dentiscutata erythropus TaxID=1348616 RepID=A0A9N8W039_9GLOM|nr:24223_t:CDS:2 [Dentiscutata erythropus]
MEHILFIGGASSSLNFINYEPAYCRSTSGSKCDYNICIIFRTCLYLYFQIPRDQRCYETVTLRYLISDDPVITKFVFAYCAIPTSRLADHFSNDRPEKVKTLISYFLNYNLFMDKIRIIDNGLDNLSKKKTDKDS